MNSFPAAYMSVTPAVSRILLMLSSSSAVVGDGIMPIRFARCLFIVDRIARSGTVYLSAAATVAAAPRAVAQS